MTWPMIWQWQWEHDKVSHSIDHVSAEVLCKRAQEVNHPHCICDLCSCGTLKSMRHDQLCSMGIIWENRQLLLAWNTTISSKKTIISLNVLWFRGCIDATSLHRCNLLHRCNFECCVSFCLIQTCKVEEIESGRDKTLNPNPQLMNNRIATCHSGIISPTIKWYNMALSREYHRVSEMNRIMRDHLDFLCDVEIEEELTEPAALPKRIIRDRMNPLEFRPLEQLREYPRWGKKLQTMKKKLNAV